MKLDDKMCVSERECESEPVGECFRISVFVAPSESILTGPIHIGVENGWIKAAFGRRCGIILFEYHPQLEATAFPNRPLPTRNHALPFRQIQRLKRE